MSVPFRYKAMFKELFDFISIGNKVPVAELEATFAYLQKVPPAVLEKHKAKCPLSSDDFMAFIGDAQKELGTAFDELFWNYVQAFAKTQMFEGKDRLDVKVARAQLDTTVKAKKLDADAVWQKQGGGAPTVTLANVINVLKDTQSSGVTLLEILRALRPRGKKVLPPPPIGKKVVPPAAMSPTGKEPAPKPAATSNVTPPAASSQSSTVDATAPSAKAPEVEPASPKEPEAASPTKTDGPPSPDGTLVAPDAALGSPTSPRRNVQFESLASSQLGQTAEYPDGPASPSAGRSQSPRLDPSGPADIGGEFMLDGIANSASFSFRRSASGANPTRANAQPATAPPKVEPPRMVDHGVNVNTGPVETVSKAALDILNELEAQRDTLRRNLEEETRKIDESSSVLEALKAQIAALRGDSPSHQKIDSQIRNLDDKMSEFLRLTRSQQDNIRNEIESLRKAEALEMHRASLSQRLSANRTSVAEVEEHNAIRLIASLDRFEAEKRSIAEKDRAARQLERIHAQELALQREIRELAKRAADSASPKDINRITAAAKSNNTESEERSNAPNEPSSPTALPPTPEHHQERVDIGLPIGRGVTVPSGISPLNSPFVRVKSGDLANAVTAQYRTRSLDAAAQAPREPTIAIAQHTMVPSYRTGDSPFDFSRSAPRSSALQAAPNPYLHRLTKSTAAQDRQLRPAFTATRR